MDSKNGRLWIFHKSNEIPKSNIRCVNEIHWRKIKLEFTEGQHIIISASDLVKISSDASKIKRLVLTKRNIFPFDRSTNSEIDKNTMYTKRTNMSSFCDYNLHEINRSAELFFLPSLMFAIRSKTLVIRSIYPFFYLSNRFMRWCGAVRCCLHCIRLLIIYQRGKKHTQTVILV